MGYQEDESDRTGRLYRAHGMIPSSQRVWSSGRDITHQDPSTWGFPYSLYVSGARGPALQADYLRWHAEAVAERGEVPAGPPPAGTSERTAPPQG